jgi:K+-transporting ATPase ATPase A chain
MQTTLLLSAHLLLTLGGAVLLARYLHAVYDGRVRFLEPLLGPVERGFYRLARINPERDMRWREYARSVLVFSVVGVFVLYALQRLQHRLPLNPDDLPAVEPTVALNTAISFVTNTNWQSYGGETTMSYLTQMLGLTTQNFISPAVGMAVAVALIRSMRRASSDGIGNFWRDMTRSILYVLVPLALVLSLVLVATGVPQTLDGAARAETLEGAAQAIARGPVASQVAIKQLGTNGGGFFNVNSAHPLENPTPLSNLLQTWALVLIAFAFPLLFGRMVGRAREGWVILAAMLVILGVGTGAVVYSESQASPAITAATAQTDVPNMEGKEQRFTPAESGTWAAFTTGTSNGSVNSMHDSYNAIGGTTVIFLMLLGEVAPGGVGSGMYGMLLLAVLTVFLSGLMIGRTPQYLGKRIGQREIKLTLIGILIMPIGLLITLVVALLMGSAGTSPANVGGHGYSEILYAFTSQWNNNGSAFAGLTMTREYNLLGSLSLWLGRFGILLAVLALAGTFARQQPQPADGAMPTANATFLVLLVGVVVIVGALAFIPALALGPIAESLTEALS